MLGRSTAIAAIIACAGLAPAAAAAAGFQSVYGFPGGAGGAAPYGRLIYNPATGLLYGTTVSGGGGGGTIFQFDPVSNTRTTLYSFTLGGADGSSPQTSMVLGHHGVLYGVTTNGGSSANCTYGCGTIFKFDPVSKTLSTLYSFTGQADGGLPEGRPALDAAQTALYGTTRFGGGVAGCGLSGCGTIYKFVLASKTYTVLHAFDVSTNDGSAAVSGMVHDGAGIFYGAASSGGTHGYGIVYRLDSVTGTYGVLHSFDYHVDGTAPRSDLLLRNGMIYGETNGGGPTANGYGTIFAINVATGVATTLYSFTNGTDGIFPDGGLVGGPAGRLYGTAAQGTGQGAGTVFSINPATKAFTALHDFIYSTEGALPESGLTRVGTSAFYGVTSYGNGTIFKVTP